MKRKIVLISAVVLSLLGILAAGTVAFFTTSEEATNIITSGELSMILHDETTGGVPFPADGMHNLLPGDQVDKIVYITNDCPNAEYVRIYLEKHIQAQEGSNAELDFERITLDINDTMWTLGDDGWYYYNSVLEPGQDTEPLFTKVFFDKTLGNDYANCSLEIIVHAQAVQSKHNGDSALLAKGWPTYDFMTAE